jgi:hypothetical protein
VYGQKKHALKARVFWSSHQISLFHILFVVWGKKIVAMRFTIYPIKDLLLL